MFTELFKNIGNSKERKLEEVFNRGRELGFEDGQQDVRDKLFQHTQEVSKEKYDKLIKFLMDNNLEITYSVRNGGSGLMIRQNNRS